MMTMMTMLPEANQKSWFLIGCQLGECGRQPSCSELSVSGWMSLQQLLSATELQTLVTQRLQESGSGWFPVLFAVPPLPAPVHTASL